MQVIAALVQGAGHFLQRACIGRIQREHLPVVRFGEFGLVGLERARGGVAHRDGRGLVERIGECLAEPGVGFERMAGTAQPCAVVVEDVALVRRQLGRFCVACLGLRGTIDPFVQHAEHRVGVGRGRLEFHRVLQAVERDLVLAGFDVLLGQRDIGLRCAMRLVIVIAKTDLFALVAAAFATNPVAASQRAQRAGDSDQQPCIMQPHRRSPRVQVRFVRACDETLPAGGYGRAPGP